MTACVTVWCSSSVSFAQVGDQSICMPVAPPSASLVWALVAIVATDLATRGIRDSSVYVPAVQDHDSCKRPSESWGVLAPVLTHSAVGTSGCREYESPAVVLELVVGGMANVDSVVFSICRYACFRGARAPTSWGPTSGEIPERPTALARVENLSYARRGGSSSCSEEWHGRGIDPGLGH